MDKCTGSGLCIFPVGFVGFLSGQHSLSGICPLSSLHSLASSICSVSDLFAYSFRLLILPVESIPSRPCFAAVCERERNLAPLRTVSLLVGSLQVNLWRSSSWVRCIPLILQLWLERKGFLGESMGARQQDPYTTNSLKKKCGQVGADWDLWTKEKFKKYHLSGKNPQRTPSHKFN